MSGRIDLSPWVRQALTPAERATLAAHVPHGTRVEVTTDRRFWSIRVDGREALRVSCRMALTDAVDMALGRAVA